MKCIGVSPRRCRPLWENQMIWSDMETRTNLPQSMIDAANAQLS